MRCGPGSPWKRHDDKAVWGAIQNSQKRLRTLAKRYAINQTTVAKWKKRTPVHDLPTGRNQPKSTVLSAEDEAIIVAFRRHTLLPLDDCLCVLQPTIPHLTRSSLHRCLQRHGISRLPHVEGDKPAKKRFKSYPIGFFHIDIAEVRTAEGMLQLFVAIDRTSKFAFAQLVEKANRVTASAFLVELIKAVPYRIHTVLTDNAIQFRYPPRTANGPTARYMTHMFVKRFHYDDHDHLRIYLADFIDAHNYGRRLKTLEGLTPYEFICKRWTPSPNDPLRQMPGLNT